MYRALISGFATRVWPAKITLQRRASLEKKEALRTNHCVRVTADYSFSFLLLSITVPMKQLSYVYTALQFGKCGKPTDSC